ncbi:MAG: hypothetical protein JSW05_08185 [Candidatus Thorarchaeota archaeon]|nr:MAG: hypothetical protein JSW05_08185 [Candidatus Thorarchaeota archaeon]
MSGLHPDRIHLRIMMGLQRPPIKAFLLNPAPQPNTMSDLSRNAQCVLNILQNATNPLTTSEILEIARSDEHADICQDCAGGDTFIVAARQLVDKGLISKTLGKGGYRWQLVRGD